MPKSLPSDESIREMLQNERTISDLLPEEDKKALADALKCGRYLLLIARREHQGSKPLKWHYRQTDFPREDQLLAPQQLADLVQRATKADHAFTVPRIEDQTTDTNTNAIPDVVQQD